MSEAGEIAVEALRDECSQAIHDIRNRRGTETCAAHDALCRGVIVLLRCQMATLGQARRQYVVAAGVATVLGAVTPMVLKLVGVL